MNPSKKHDVRFWIKWYAAGAVSKIQIIWPSGNPYSEKERLDFIERTEDMKRNIAKKLLEEPLVEGIFQSHMNTPTHGGRIY